MDFYNDPEKVDDYEQMCDGYDGSELYAVLGRHLEDASTLLELGSGPGNDIAYLRRRYRVTGSDLSDEFLSRCRQRFTDTPFLKLDAVSIDTDETYDGIFSNKVLHHLTQDELAQSFKRQQDVIKSGGLFAHTFWLGGKAFEMNNMLFVCYEEEMLLAAVSRYFDICETYGYKEFEEGDSLMVVARNRQ